MAADGCVFHRILSRSGSGPSQAPVLCRDLLVVLQLRRYGRDQGSAVYFPQSVLSGDDLYDVTLTDGHCRLRVTLDPGLNQQVERRVLRAGSTLGQASFSPTFSPQVPGGPDSPREVSYRLVNMVVRDEEEDGEDAAFGVLDVDSLPWFGSSEPAGPDVPLRASRSVFLPLWNNVDYSGDAWREAPPPEENDDEEEGLRPAVSVSELRDFFLSGRRGRARGQLIVRITNKSQLMYFGRAGENCECPYKAVLEVCDRTGSACVVLWNSMCVSWYRCLKPGDIISLRRYRVKQRYLGEAGDIEISVNSRNPAAHLSLLSECRVLAEYTPPEPSFTFCSSQELLDRPHGTTCDVIGLLTFAGRSERVRSRGEGLLEYRWLQLEDDSGVQPIRVKLFSTSQPETHRRLHPLSVVVCTRLKLIRSDQSCFYLTNTIFTQVYCTGLDQHSRMSYRKLPAVRRFLRWLRSQDDGQVLSRALIGGFFIHPPPPVSLETFMKERKGELGFLRGAELQRELQSLRFRERRSFCVQATVTMVTYSLRGADDRCMFWMERPPSSPSSPQLPLSSPPLLYLSPTPPSVRPSPSSPPSSARSSVVGLSTPHRSGGSRKLSKRRLMLPGTPKKRLPWATIEPEHNKTVILFQASMEFLENPEDEEEEQDDEDVSSFTTAPLPPAFQPVAMETLPMRFDHAHREEQAALVTMEGGATARTFNSAPEDYYTLKLRVLSDGIQVDAVFLPHSSSSFSSVSSLRGHANTWASILSHGAFSSHSPPPSPADLIATADRLTNRRLVCVLEACHLGGARTELVLTRAFHLTD